MSERCGKCQRVLVSDHRDPNWLTGCRDIAGIGDEMDAMLCEIASESYQRGLREGVELAKEHADAGTVYIGSGDYVGDVDWSAVDEELAKRIDR